jgi:hypothetical protein
MNEFEKKFEPTEAYKTKLEKIRRLSQDTEEARAEKKEQAKEFRMEVMLDNARLMSNLTAQLEWNPWSTTEDLQHSTNTTAEYLAHPEVAQNFINDLQAAKTRVELVLGKPENKEITAQKIYQELISGKSSDYEPKGKIEVDLTYPLAIMLFVENIEDFEMIDPRENVGGFYRASHTFVSGVPEVSAPVIVIKGQFESPNKAPATRRTATRRIVKHEKGHAEHERLISSLKTSRRKTVWFKSQPNLLTLIDLVGGYWLKESGSAKQPEIAKEFEIVLNYALARAKDEILAELKATPDDVRGHIKNLKRQGGVYDYFLGLDISTDTQVYKDLWSAYNKKLDEAVKSLNLLLNIYSMWSLGYRCKAIRWVMAQVPLKDWSKQINESGFKKEAEMLLELMKQTNGMLTQDGKLSPALNKVIHQINTHQWHSFIPIIERYLEENSTVTRPKG